MIHDSITTLPTTRICDQCEGMEYLNKNKKKSRQQNPTYRRIDFKSFLDVPKKLK